MLKSLFDFNFQKVQKGHSVVELARTNGSQFGLTIAGECLIF
jgi:hypothetical protein